MKYIVPNYKLGIVNKFADYLLSEIDKDNDTYTSLQVVMFNEFFVIDGFTSSKNRIDLNDLKEKFYLQNKDLFERLVIKSINTIDIIKYDAPIPQFSMCFDFHSSLRPMFHEKVLEYAYNNPLSEWDYVDYNDELTMGINYLFEKPNNTFYTSNFGVVKSEFPHGFSLLYGRAALYYSEYIVNHLISVVMSDKIIVEYRDFNDENGNPNFAINCKSPYPIEKINSIVFDVFDFNIDRFIKKYLMNYDLKSDVDTQLEKKPWLVKDKINELYII